MKKSLIFVLVFVLTITLGYGAAIAAASSKFAAEVSDVKLVPMKANTPWRTVLSANIKTPNQKDLLVGVSFETALYTETVVKSKGGVKDTSSAEAKLLVRLKVDGIKGANLDNVCPNKVVYDRRAQELSAVLGGILTGAQDIGTFELDPATGVCNEVLFEYCDGATGYGVNPGEGTETCLDGVITLPCEFTLADEEIELVLDTMSAHHFNFVVKNLESGMHTIEAQVKIVTDGDSENGSWSAKAGVGKGSLTIEEVRATNSPDGIEFDFAN